MKNNIWGDVLGLLNEIKFDDKGLVPVITQDFITLEVLMLGYMNKEAYLKTIETNTVTYFSRSRQKLWVKGETSGHFQKVKQIFYDCDIDTLLIKIEQLGAACHTGNKSCFYRSATDIKKPELEKTDYDEKVILELYETIVDRKENPIEGAYTNYLFNKGLDKMLKKVGEESAEVIIASKNRDKNEITCEVADLMYHLSVTMVETGVCWSDVFSELVNRRSKIK